MPGLVFMRQKKDLLAPGHIQGKLELATFAAEELVESAIMDDPNLPLEDLTLIGNMVLASTSRSLGGFSEFADNCSLTLAIYWKKEKYL